MPGTHLTRSGPLLWTNLGIVYVVWGSTYLAIEFMGESMPPLLGSGLRFLVASVLMLIVTLIVRGRAALAAGRRRIASALFLGIIMLSVGIGTVSLAERYVPIGIAAIIIAITPLVIVLLRLLSGDRPRWPTLLGVAVGFAGLAWMLLPGGTQPVSGTQSDVVLWTFLLVCSSTLWATGAWLAQRIPVPADSFAFTTYEMLAAGVVLTSVGLLHGDRLDAEHISARSWAGWIYLVLIGSVLAYAAYTWLISKAPISLVSTYAYVNPLVAVLLGLLVLSQPLTSDVVIGLVVVLGGVVLVISGESTRSADRADAAVRAGSLEDGD